MDEDLETSRQAVGIDRNDAAKPTKGRGGGGVCPSRLPSGSAATGDDMFDLTIKSFHSNFAPNGPLDDISEAGKDLLEFFFKEPNAGSPWKLGFAGSPNQNLGTLIRGNLIELHSAKVGRHKTASYLDELNDGVVEGLDFEYADGLVVQQTSTALPAASDQMLDKLDKAARAALASKGEG